MYVGNPSERRKCNHRLATGHLGGPGGRGMLAWRPPRQARRFAPRLSERSSGPLPGAAQLSKMTDFCKTKKKKNKLTTAARRRTAHASRRRPIPTRQEARARAGNTSTPRSDWTTTSSKRPRPLGSGLPPIRPRAAGPCWAGPRWRTTSRPARRRASRHRSTSCSSLLPASAARRRPPAQPS